MNAPRNYLFDYAGTPVYVYVSAFVELGQVFVMRMTKEDVATFPGQRIGYSVFSCMKLKMSAVVIALSLFEKKIAEDAAIQPMLKIVKEDPAV